ncbi:hypothetical protein C8R46DRAFT_885627, partial [Mycena filopes]
SNANLTLFEPRSGTGGSWKKSPVTMSWMPPNGFRSLRKMLPMRESLSNRSPSSMDTAAWHVNKRRQGRKTTTDLHR